MVNKLESILIWIIYIYRIIRQKSMLLNVDLEKTFKV